MIPFPTCGCLFWAACLPGHWCLPLVSFTLPSLGDFFLYSLARFHHIRRLLGRKEWFPRDINEGSFIKKVSNESFFYAQQVASGD